MKYARTIAAVLGGMSIAYAARLEGGAHWALLLAGGVLIGASLTVLQQKKK